MAVFLPVAPANYLHALQKYTGCSKAFFLSHEVVQDPKGYGEVAERCSYSILDNSLIELGKAVSLDMIKDADVILGNRSYVVLPDVLCDSLGTLAEISKHYNAFAEAFPRRLLAIPQGATKEEWIACFGIIMRDYPVQMIGIPRNVVGRIVASRRELIEVVTMIAPNMPIHLMGFSDNMVDDALSARSHPNVRSIDSNAPLRCTDFSVFSPIPPRGDWWELNKGVQVEEIPAAVLESVSNANRMVHGEGHIQGAVLVDGALTANNLLKRG